VCLLSFLFCSLFLCRFYHLMPNLIFSPRPAWLVWLLGMVRVSTVRVYI
jgi:hypothetical protein